MSITRLSSVLAALVTAVALAPRVQAELFKPFAFPPVESDFQFFAPADVDTYGGGPAPKTGWFAAYDRMYMNVQRPADTHYMANKEGDFTWGNRVDVGYVGDNNKGWLCTIWHIDGPSTTDIIVTERLNRFITDAAPDAVPIYPIRDNNNRVTGARDYLVEDYVNVADLSGVELNRTWQLDQLHNGGFLTPFVGLRYAKFKDYYQRQLYGRLDEDGFPVPPSGPGDALSATTEFLDSLDGTVTNDMLGGQLGVHWSQDYRRWNFSGDFKAFAFENFQYWRTTNYREYTIFGGTLPLDDTLPDTVIMSERGFSSTNSEFVFGMELRFDAAYRLTRDLSLRGGAEFMDFGQGIGRGINQADNNQGVIMYGFSVGLTYNR